MCLEHTAIYLVFGWVHDNNRALPCSGVWVRLIERVVGVANTPLTRLFVHNIVFPQQDTLRAC